MPESNPPSSGYGKRPLWQWIVIYLIVGGLIYFGVYYFFLKGKYNYSGGYNYNSGTPSTQTQPYRY